MKESTLDTLAVVISSFWNASSPDVQSSFDHKKFYVDLKDIFDAEPDFLKKLAAVDNLIDENPEIASLREYIVDLLFIHFFNEDVLRLDEDYLETPEWEHIEDKTIDRGTELLNLHLYIQECNEEEEEPEISHFLKEFLLVDEDEFQDEYEIYEQVIANQILVEAEQSEIAKVYTSVPANDDIKDVFYPLMSFFSNTVFDQKGFDEYLQFSDNKAYDAAILAGLYSYNHGNGLFSESFLNCKD